MRPAGVILVAAAVVVLAAALIFLPGDPGDRDAVIAGAERAAARDEPGAMVSEIDSDSRSRSRENLSREDEVYAAIRAGPSLSGTVTDHATGDPIPHCAVSLWEGPTPEGGCRKIRFGRCFSDSLGRFAIPIDRLGLRADAVYNLVFSSNSHTLAIVDNLEVAPREGIAGIDAPLQRMGLLRIRGIGFDIADFRRLSLELVNPAIEAREAAWRDRGFSNKMIGRSQGALTFRSAQLGPRAFSKADQTWEHTLFVAPGSWAITVSTGAETMVRDATVPSGAAVSVEIERHTLLSPFTVLGTLTFTDGSPVRGARVFFFAEQVSSLDRNERYRYVERRAVYEACRTDGRGEFRPRNLLPGQWRIDVILEGGGKPFLPYVIIPEDPPDPYRIEFVVPRGSVSGTLCDRETHLPLDADFTEWFFLVRHCDTGRVAAELNNHIGVDFHVAAVPAGKLRLEVRATGFEDYRSEPFTLSAGQNLNLGNLAVARTSRFGSLIVAIVDERGEPFDKPVQVALFRSLGRADHWEALLPGQAGMSQKTAGTNSFRFDHLPAQELRIVVYGGAARLPNPGRYVRQNLREWDVLIKAGETAEIDLAIDSRYENW